MIGYAIKGRENVQRNLGRATASVKNQLANVAQATVIVETDLRLRSFTGRKGQLPFIGVIGAPYRSGTLGVRTGGLRNSITSQVFASGSVTFGAVGTPSFIALVHEHGLTIAPGRLMRIPTRYAKTGAGVDRHAGHSVRGLGFQFVTKKATGTKLLLNITKSPAEVWYILKNRITLKPRKMFERATKRIAPVLNKLFDSRIAAVVNEANR